MRLIIAIVVLSVDAVKTQGNELAHANVKARAFIATDDGTEQSPMPVHELGNFQFAASGPLAYHLQPGDTFEIPLDPFQSVRRADVEGQH